MAQKSNPKLVGAFVLGAIGLVVAIVVVFSSGQWFTQKHKVVMFFSGNVAGLSVGAPVNFRGVKVGEVTNVILIASGETKKNVDLLIPVYAEIERNRVVRRTGFKPMPIQEALDLLVSRGVRAQLSQLSFVTGQLAVNLDFHADVPAKYVGADKRYQEIPTVASTFEQITKSIAELPISELLAAVQATVNNINKLVKSPEIGKAIKSARLALDSFERLAAHLDKELSPTTTELRQAVRSAKQTVEQATTTLKSYDTLARSATKEIDPLAKSIKGTMTSAQAALGEAEKAVKMVAPGSPLQRELLTMAQELSAASRSIRLFTEYLERHPEALVRGKGGRGQR